MIRQDTLSMQSILPTMRRTEGCIMAIRTTLKRRSTMILLFRGTTCASATMELNIIFFQNRIMLLNAMSILQMKFEDSRMAMTSLRISKLMERN